MLGQVCASNGTDGGAHHATEGIDGHGSAAALRSHHVTDAAGAVGHGAGACTSGKEAEACEHGQGRAEGAGYGEEDEEDATGVIER